MRRTLVEAPPDPVSLLSALRERGDAFLLQSAEGPRRLARYSFLGFRPESRLTVEHGQAYLDGDPLEASPTAALREVVAGRRTDDDEGYPFNGGLVGYLGYGYTSYLEDLPRPEPAPKAPGPFPDVEMGLFLDGIIYDHERRTCFYFTQAEDRFDEIPLQEARGEAGRSRTCKVGQITTSHDRQAFGGIVDRAKAYIEDGHIFQVVLSRAFQASYEGSPVAAYERLLEINPSPYMFYLSFDDRDVFGASPEMLVRVEDSRVETDPIAGTRPLGATPAETEAYEADLRASEKERAEHAMLVDLARNDVGRVARPGSVEVETLMSVERYSHVQHLVSRVAGDLAAGHDAVDALNAIFPAGTVSGAPKVRAMEIIAELEATARGPYAGCVGYLSLNGNLDSAITIRSAWAAGDALQIQAGAGIVADSDPSAEFDETQAKGEALLDVLQGDGGWLA